MKRELSILIPVFNNECTALVRELSRQAEAIDGLCYEIIVADDGSDNQQFINHNSEISALPHCSYIVRDKNVGRAAIRNFLAQQAHYEWLLFIDADMTVVRDDFILRYLETPLESQVVYGGYEVGKGDATNLRYRYETAEAHEHTAEQRQQRPYLHFHTSNFMVSRQVMGEHPFDERFRNYGYEDVFFGKQLRQAGIAIHHIDNPMGFCDFEENAHFVSKTEEGLRTLHQFRNDLRGYSNLITFVDGIHLGVVRGCIRLWHRCFKGMERKNLTGSHPSLRVFKLYKLGYFLEIED